MSLITNYLSKIHKYGDVSIQCPLYKNGKINAVNLQLLFSLFFLERHYTQSVNMISSETACA